MKRPRLSRCQADVLNEIKRSIRVRGVPPTLREICKVLGLKSTNGASEHLQTLERKGYITRSDGLSRGIRLVATPRTEALTFAAYQHETARTGGSDLVPGNEDRGLNAAALGLAGESSEALAVVNLALIEAIVAQMSVHAGMFADIVKKSQHMGVPLDTAKLRKELGDVQWYASHACNVMRWDLGEIAMENIAKLRTRYPDGFSVKACIERRDAEADDHPDGGEN